MNREIINTKAAPSAIGPYSQAIKIANMIYTSGQIPIDPTTGNVVDGGVEAQTKRALENLRAVLEEGGSSLEKVIKTTVFIKSMNDFAAINKIYGEYFTANYPSRSCVEVARLPKDVLVEIEAIAII